MMANSFIDRLIPQQAQFGTPAGEYQPKPGEQPLGTIKLDAPEPTRTEQIALAKDDSRFSGDADAVVITAVKECVATLQRCIASGKYDDAINHTYTLRGLVCGYADFKCGTIFALKDSKK